MTAERSHARRMERTGMEKWELVNGEKINGDASPNGERIDGDASPNGERIDGDASPKGERIDDDASPNGEPNKGERRKAGRARCIANSQTATVA